MKQEQFLQPAQVNMIRKQLNLLIRAFYFAGDYRVLASARESVMDSIHEMFIGLTPEQKQLIDEGSNVRDPEELKLYLSKLSQYVIPFPTITVAEIRKLFPKVKKLVLPDLNAIDYSKLSYLGWRDIATNSLYIVYQVNGKWVGTECRYTLGFKNRQFICMWCKHSRSGHEAALVTTKVKAKHLADGYATVGNHLCLDSDKCNADMTSTLEMETFLAGLR